MDNKRELNLIKKLVRWIKDFEKNSNTCEFTPQISHRLLIDLKDNLDFVIDVRNLVVNFNLRDDFGKFVKDIKGDVHDIYYELHANKNEKRITLHVVITPDYEYYNEIRRLVELCVNNPLVNIYLDDNNKLLVSCGFDNGYTVYFEKVYDDDFEVYIKKIDSDEYLDFNIFNVSSSYIPGIINKMELLQKEELDTSFTVIEFLDKTGLYLRNNGND